MYTDNVYSVTWIPSNLWWQNSSKYTSYKAMRLWDYRKLLHGLSAARC